MEIFVDGLYIGHTYKIDDYKYILVGYNIKRKQAILMNFYSEKIYYVYRHILMNEQHFEDKIYVVTSPETILPLGFVVEQKKDKFECLDDKVKLITNENLLYVNALRNQISKRYENYKIEALFSYDYCRDGSFFLENEYIGLRPFCFLGTEHTYSFTPVVFYKTDDYIFEKYMFRDFRLRNWIISNDTELSRILKKYICVSLE